MNVQFKHKPLVANLFAQLTVAWEDRRGCDRDCEVEVDYTFDGENLEITKWVVGGTGPSDDELEESVLEQLWDIAPQEYAEWLGDYGDYLYEQAQDRRADGAA